MSVSENNFKGINSVTGSRKDRKALQRVAKLAGGTVHINKDWRGWRPGDNTELTATALQVASGIPLSKLNSQNGKTDQRRTAMNSEIRT